jgi:subtilisin
MDIPHDEDFVEAESLLQWLREADGVAFVGLKGPAHLRTAERTLMTTDLASPTARSIRQGVRPALGVDEIREALKSLEARGATIVRYYGALGVALVRIPLDSAEVIRAHPTVDYFTPLREGPLLGGAVPSATLSVSDPQVVPWNIDSVGAPLAWPYSRGFGARLLIIDTGHDWSHPDLGVVPFSNCNHGIYSGCNDNYPQYHGTAVAGVAIARDNSVGVVGVAPDISPAHIYYWGACSVTACSFPEIIAALDSATAILGGKGVINMSFGGLSAYTPLANAVAAALNAGHVLVSLAGNTGTNQVIYPAGYSGVIGVGGINQDNTLNSQSTYGPHVDFVAPWDAYTTKPANQYDWRGGTSISAPHVAGVVALLRAKYPSWNHASIYNRLQRTAQGLGNPSLYGWGKVRAHLAVAFEGPSISVSITAAGKPRLTWASVPFATNYRVYRRVTPTLAPNWELWAQTTATSYTDFTTSVTSFYGYNSQPATIAVSYYVVGYTSGVETEFVMYATYIPNGTPPF